MVHFRPTRVTSVMPCAILLMESVISPVLAMAASLRSRSKNFNSSSGPFCTTIGCITIGIVALVLRKPLNSRTLGMREANVRCKPLRPPLWNCLLLLRVSIWRVGARRRGLAGVSANGCNQIEVLS